jgi:hypothetical protein
MRVKSLVINWKQPAEPWHPGGTFPRRPRNASLWPLLFSVAIATTFSLFAGCESMLGITDNRIAYWKAKAEACELQRQATDELNEKAETELARERAAKGSAIAQLRQAQADAEALHARLSAVREEVCGE